MQKQRLIRTVIVDDEKPARTVLKHLLGAQPDLELVAECDSSTSAIDAITLHKPDLLLLDINLPDFDGFELLRMLDKKHSPYVIFVTAYHEYALKAFESHALDYLLKPPTPERFAMSVQRARDAVSNSSRNQQRSRIERLLKELHTFSASADGIAHADGTTGRYPSHITTRERSGIRSIKLEHVLRLEAYDHYTRVFLHGETLLVSQTLSEVQALLDPRIFVRIRRNAILNLKYLSAVSVGKYGALALRLLDGHVVTTSRNIPDAVRRQLLAHKAG